MTDAEARLAGARSGRRPGDPDTRGAILEAARARFAEAGYAAASIRSIAAAAGVDPALVYHYFGSKQDLFTAALAIPIEPSVVVRTLLDGDADDIGRRVVRTMIGLWDTPEGRARFSGLVRSVATEESAARMMREFLTDEVVGPVVASLGSDQARLRASLAVSQMVGLAFSRYILRVEPLTSTDSATLEAAIGPTMQRYLAGDLDGTPDA